MVELEKQQRGLQNEGDALLMVSKGLLSPVPSIPEDFQQGIPVLELCESMPLLVALGVTWKLGWVVQPHMKRSCCPALVEM